MKFFLLSFILFLIFSSILSSYNCPFRNNNYDCSNKSLFISFLNQFQPSLFLKILSNLNIYIIGDSISTQQYRSLICQLEQYSQPSLLIQINSLNLTKNKVNHIQSWLCISFQYNVSICWADDVVNRGNKFKKMNEPDILIWNVAGLHSHSENDHYQKLMRLIYYTRKNQYYPFNRTNNIERLIIYRETTPQAFAGSITGDYDQRDEKIAYCQSPYFNPKYQNISYNYNRDENQSYNPYNISNISHNLTNYLTYRQKLERSILPSRKIPLLYIHDITLLRGTEQYIGFPDCSHFCDPGTPQIWNQLLYEYVINSPIIPLIQKNKIKG